MIASSSTDAGAGRRKGTPRHYRATPDGTPRSRRRALSTAVRCPAAPPAPGPTTHIFFDFEIVDDTARQRFMNTTYTLPTTWRPGTAHTCETGGHTTVWRGTAHVPDMVSRALLPDSLQPASWSILKYPQVSNLLIDGLVVARAPQAQFANGCHFPRLANGGAPDASHDH
jgi:hypothetical protein